MLASDRELTAHDGILTYHDRILSAREHSTQMLGFDSITTMNYVEDYIILIFRREKLLIQFNHKVNRGAFVLGSNIWQL